jgi:hypothetical protein
MLKYADYKHRDHWPDEYDGVLTLDQWDVGADMQGEYDGSQ